MNLMTGERVLLETNQKTLTLTTHRVRYHVQYPGYTQIISIMLEELSSCAMSRTTNPIFLVLAALCVVFGFIIGAGARASGFILIGLIVGAIFIFLFFATRQQVISLSSAGTSIRVKTMGMKAEDVQAFIEATETAKNARYLLARGS